jgi:hypothetical protein
VPTHDELTRFLREYASLTPEQQRRFRAAVRQFIDDLPSGRFRPTLRVKKMGAHDDLWEMTWDRDGRAVFEYGVTRETTGRHVIWRRIGTHEIFNDP